MKVANIALFKRFLFENGVNTMFKGLYNQFRFPENPEDVEEYLEKVDQQNVILMAFKFPKNLSQSNHGEDFWTEMAVKWENLVEKMTKEGYYTTYPKAVERYNTEAAIPLDRFKRGLQGVIKKNFREDQKTAQMEQQHTAPESKPVRPTVVDEETAALNGFQTVPVKRSGLKDFGTFEYFCLDKKSSPKMKDDEFSISSKKGAYKLTFNKQVSEMVTEAGLTRFRIGQDKVTGEVRILFGNFPENDSMPFTVSKSTNLTIANKSLVGILTNVFSLRESLTTLYLSKNLANSKDYVVFIITKERQR